MRYVTTSVPKLQWTYCTSDRAYPSWNICIMTLPYKEEENTKDAKQSLSLRKGSLNIPCLKGQFENLSSRSEYASNHLSSVLMNSACESSVRDFLRTVRSVLLKNVLKEASIRRVIGRCNSSGQLFCRQSTNSVLSVILDTPSKLEISECFWRPICRGCPSAQSAYSFGQFLIWEGRPDPMD